MLKMYCGVKSRGVTCPVQGFRKILETEAMMVWMLSEHQKKTEENFCITVKKKQKAQCWCWCLWFNVSNG
jgi:hypothetical protein